MSALNRFASGSIASWARIGITLGSQILLVPLYLHYWSIDQYGCWLTVQTVQGFLTLFSTGHNNFVGFEMLRLDPRNSGSFSRLLSASIPFAVAIAMFELLITIVLVLSPGMRLVVDSRHTLSAELLRQTGLSAIFLGAVWVVASSVGGILGRAIAPLGHYPRNAWWGVFGALVVAIGNAAAVIAGADVFMTAIVQGLITIAYNVPLHWDFLKLLKRHGIHVGRPDMKMGFANAVKSLAIAGKMFLEILRLQGTRLIVSSMMNVTAMVAFSTMRTASNVILQGVSTITSPVMPELNRYLRDRDDDRTSATFGFMWLMLAIMMGPVIVSLQFYAPVLFELWTHGKVAFNPIVFGLFSVSLLIFSTVQPAMTVLQGQNLLREQFFITLAMVVIMLSGMALLVPVIGLTGAAVSIVASEALGMALYFYVAARWFAANNMSWPIGIARISIASTIVGAAAVMAMCFTEKWHIVILVISFIAQLGLGAAFWTRLPEVARKRVDALLGKLKKSSQA